MGVAGGGKGGQTKGADGHRRIAGGTKGHDTFELEPAGPEHPEPDTVRRRCTDVGWLLPFFACVGAVVYLWASGVPGSDVNRVKHFMDATGQLCGAGKAKDKTYLYFCLQQDHLEPDVFRTHCVERCPEGNSTPPQCGIVTEGDNTPRLPPGYTCFPFIGLMCLPYGDKYQNLTSDILKGEKGLRKHFGSPSVWLRMARHAWKPLVGTAIWALIASYSFIYMIKVCARSMVWMGITVMCIVPLFYGSTMLICWYSGRFCWLVLLQGSVMDGFEQVLSGVFSITVGLLFACLLTRQVSDIELAINCIEWSVKCVFDSPTLIIAPVMTLGLRFGVSLLLYKSGNELLSCFHVDMMTFVPNPPMQDIILAFLLVAILFWILQYLNANAHFVIIYSTELWYLHGGLEGRGHTIPVCRMLKGWWAVLRYHQGTMALGALAAGSAQPFRIVFGVLTSVARMEHNPIGRVIGAACCCFVEFYETVLEPMSRNAYMEVAMSSMPFCEASQFTQDILAEDDVAHLLNGATWLFQIAGLGSIAASGFLMTQLFVTFGVGSDKFSDPLESDYVFNVTVHSLMGGIISLFVAFPFMMLFDLVSDAVLYCYLIEQMRKAAEEEIEGDFTKSVREYLGDLVGCSCSFRPKGGRQSHLGHGHLPLRDAAPQDTPREARNAAAPPQKGGKAPKGSGGNGSSWGLESGRSAQGGSGRTTSGPGRPGRRHSAAEGGNPRRVRRAAPW